MIELEFDGLNEHLCNKMDEGSPFSLLRIDNTFGYVTQCIFNGVSPSSQYFNLHSMKYEGGVYPATFEYWYQHVFRQNVAAMLASNVLGFVDISLQIKNDKNFLNSNFNNKHMFFGHESIMVLDPIGLIRGGLQRVSYPKEIWTEHLKGKKVIYIGTHCDSVKSQWGKIDDIWGENRKRVAPFELTNVIRSPYPPETDIRQYPNCTQWHESVDYIKKLMDESEYDVAFCASSSSAPIFAQHAQMRGKIGIQTGGVAQLFFGVKGSRWAKVDGYAAWRDYFNDSWIYPLESDKPLQIVQGLETNFAYW